MWRDLFYHDEVTIGFAGCFQDDDDGCIRAATTTAGRLMWYISIFVLTEKLFHSLIFGKESISNFGQLAFEYLVETVFQCVGADNASVQRVEDDTSASTTVLLS